MFSELFTLGRLEKLLHFCLHACTPHTAAAHPQELCMWQHGFALYMAWHGWMVMEEGMRIRQIGESQISNGVCDNGRTQFQDSVLFLAFLYTRALPRLARMAWHACT